MPTYVAGVLVLTVGAAALLLAIPALVLLAQVLAARVRPPVPHLQTPRPRLAVLIPACNEAAGIAATIEALKSQLCADDTLLVVADNCNDNTAACARAAGAVVIERHDLSLRGKSYALDFGVRHLAAHPPSVVIVIDADCCVQADSLDRLAQRCIETQAPAQALYLMTAPMGAGLKTRIAAFAWIVKNHVRPLGAARLGAPCQLMGTGMAFPWALIANAPLASGHIVEDLRLGVDMALAGTPPQFCPEARVDSVFTRNPEGLETQRRRWEHGHLGVMFEAGPRLLLHALTARSPSLLALALDLCVPPLAALLLAVLSVKFAAVLIVWTSGHWLPLQLALLPLCAITFAITLAWHRFGRDTLSLSELVRAPLWAVAKLPLYLAFLGKRQTEWVRTARDDVPTPPIETQAQGSQTSGH